jgi:hypothetical protein
MFLTRRVPALAQAPSEWTAALGRVSQAARSYGSYAFLRRLAKRLNQSEAITRETVLAATEALATALQTRNASPAKP